MLFLFKYRFLQTIREFSIMFWALGFPIILGTLFYFSFGTSIEAAGETEWDEIKTAVVTEDSSSENAKSFEIFLENMDGELLEITRVSSGDEALKLLNEDKVTGIYYVKEAPSLTVGKNGLDESILTSALDSFNQNSAMVRDVLSEHPDRLPAVLASYGDYRQSVREETDRKSTRLNSSHE